MLDLHPCKLIIVMKHSLIVLKKQIGRPFIIAPKWKYDIFEYVWKVTILDYYQHLENDENLLLRY